MKDRDKILFIAGSEFLETYSGTLYLIDALSNKGFSLISYVFCGAENRKKYKKLPIKCHPLIVGRFKNKLINKLLTAFYRAFIIVRCILSRNVIITETNFLREAALAKRINRRMNLVQFCQELYIPEEYPDFDMAHLYSRYARVPDMVIDVDKYRARLRQRRFKLKNEPMVLQNTLPTKAVPPRAQKGGLGELIGKSLTVDTPILLYMGGIGKEKPFDRIIDVVSIAKFPVYFIAFCKGSEFQIKKLLNYANKKLSNGNFVICSSVKRDVLLASAWEADIGIIDYSYSVEATSNQKFCAPTKLYEYMASGLAVLGSNNQSLRDIIEKEEIGICAADDSVSSLANALNSMIENTERLKEFKCRSVDRYRDKYCYEILLEKNINALSDFLR